MPQSAESLYSFFNPLARFEQPPDPRIAMLRGGQPPAQPPIGPQVGQAQAAQLQQFEQATQAPPQPPQMPQQGPQPSPQQPQPAQQGSRLPRALAAAQRAPQMAPPVAQQPAQPDHLDLDDARLAAKRQQAETELAQASAPPDLAAMHEAHQRRQQSASNFTMLALAAQHAGPEFQPLQVHFLKQAAEAQDPMKFAGGSLTAEGFTEDPHFGQLQKIKQIEARIGLYERAEQSNISAHEKRRLEAEREKHQVELRRMMGDIAIQVAGMSSADRRYSADLAHGDRVARQNAPKSTGSSQSTEGERTAEGYRLRMDDAQRAMQGMGNEGLASPVTQAIGAIPMAGPALRNMVESPAQTKRRGEEIEFARAKLRAESGAVIGDKEAADEARNLFPQPGDTPADIERKRQRRDTAVRAMEIKAGRAAPASAPSAVDNDPLGIRRK